MTGRLWAGARALVGLAGSNARLAERPAWRGDDQDREPTGAEFEAMRRKAPGVDEAWMREVRPSPSDHERFVMRRPVVGMARLRHGPGEIGRGMKPCPSA